MARTFTETTADLSPALRLSMALAETPPVSLAGSSMTAPVSGRTPAATISEVLTPSDPPVLQKKDDYIFNVVLPSKNTPATPPADPEAAKKKQQNQLKWGAAILAVLLIAIWVSTRKPKAA